MDSGSDLRLVHRFRGRAQNELKKESADTNPLLPVERLRPSNTSLLPAGEEATEVAARHQRLLALQRELAQLKRTPSMQLLARQRILRLEAEIKQVVTALQESA